MEVKKYWNFHISVQKEAFYNSREILIRKITGLSFFNLFLVSALGIFLRTYSIFPITFSSYKYLLHAHSHFAFGGWVMPILFILILKFFPEVSNRISLRHLKNILTLILFSAYGMLVSFPFGGYQLISISFSTLSIIAGFYLAIVTWTASRKNKSQPGIYFLRAALIFLVLSAVGPFATGPLIAMGKAGSSLYFNSIYFYLHFQYNGWFTFTILAIVYSVLQKNNKAKNAKVVFYLFFIACFPAYFLSTLWSHPPKLIYYISMAGGILQIVGFFFLIKDIYQIKKGHSFVNRVFQIAFICFSLKIILQLLSAFPIVADLAYQNRNFIIAYLHLILLGFISLFVIACILKEKEYLITRNLKAGIMLFLVSFLLSESLLILNASGVRISFAGFTFNQILLFSSIFFPIGTYLIWVNVGKISGLQPKLVNQPINLN